MARTVTSIGISVAAATLLLSACGAGKSQGTLVADIGMTLDDVKQRSSLAVVPGFRQGLTGSHLSIGTVVFDLQIGDSGVRFPVCRYYWLETGNHDDPKLAHLNIGVSNVKMPLPQLDAFEDGLRQQLKGHGFAACRFLNNTEKQLQLSGGKPTTGDGRYYARGGTLVIFQRNRIDEQKRGEDPRAGEWILYFDIVPRTQSTYVNLVCDR